MNRVPMPSRKQPLGRTMGLARTGALERRSGLAPGAPPERHTRLRPRSAKTARKYVTRRAIVAELFAEPSICEVPWCTERATDPHEPLTRARGGDILDRDNIRKVCNSHNFLFASAEEPWMYQLGFLKHSTLCCKDQDVCAQYSDWGDAA